jgi:hypothetical protein
LTFAPHVDGIVLSIVMVHDGLYVGQLNERELRTFERAVKDGEAIRAWDHLAGSAPVALMDALSTRAAGKVLARQGLTISLPGWRMTLCPHAPPHGFGSYFPLRAGTGSRGRSVYG